MLLLSSEVLFLIVESFLLTSVRSSKQKSDQSMPECSVYSSGSIRINVTNPFSLNFRGSTPKPDLINPSVCYMVSTRIPLQSKPLSDLFFIVRATERNVDNWICVLPPKNHCCCKYKLIALAP